MDDLFLEYADVIDANPELERALQNPRVLVLEVYDGPHRGTYIGPVAREVMRDIGFFGRTRFKMYSEDMSEYWASELIGMYL